MTKTYPFLIGLCCLACSPSLEDNIDRLGGSGDERAEAQQMLLLAKNRAVAPLIEALDDPERASLRIYLVDALASLMTRVDSDQIQAALDRHLRQDPDAAVRARIAHKMGVFKRTEAIDALLAVIEDEDGDVRYEALTALNTLEKKLNDSQNQILQEKTARMQHDPHADARLEALIHVERRVQKWVEDAQQAELKAQLDQADSLYAKALGFAPTSKRANYRLGRFYLDNGQPQKGMDILRQHGMVLDVPALELAPKIDGIVDAAEWAEAASADSFYILAWRHSVALPAEVATRLHIAHTDEALYIGCIAYDEHPDSLISKIQSINPTDEMLNTSLSESIWQDDIFELFIDGDFDHLDYGHFGINSLGVCSDEWQSGDRDSYRNAPEQWNWTGNAQVATHVGTDRWTLEIKIPFNNKEFPHPKPGDTWGFNTVRVFRGKQYNQWVRTYSGGHSPNDFGLLVFN